MDAVSLVFQPDYVQIFSAHLGIPVNGFQFLTVHQEQIQEWINEELFPHMIDFVRSLHPLGLSEDAFAQQTASVLEKAAREHLVRMLRQE